MKKQMKKVSDGAQITWAELLHQGLRHQPHLLNLSVSDSGWVATADLLRGLSDAGSPVTLRELIHHVRYTGRFDFGGENYGKIRATFGHSLGLNLRNLLLGSAKPLSILYHGTCHASVSNISRFGILRGERDHVFLTECKKQAYKYALLKSRNPRIIEVNAQAMYCTSKNTYKAKGPIWLCDEVRPDFINKVELAPNVRAVK